MSQPAGILALDLALVTGWAYGAPGERPIGGVWRLAGAENPGRCWASLDNTLSDALALHRPALLMMAAGFVHGKNAKSAALLIGMSAHVESCCYRYDVPIRLQAESTIRKHVLVQGVFPKPGRTAKDAAMAHCDAQRWRYADHNHADALICWQYACETAGGRFGLARAA